MRRIYLDHNATTGIDPRVREAMLLELSSIPYNPSSAHHFGKEAKARLQAYRAQVAAYCKAKPQEILFTSGGTEGMNLLIRGSLYSARPQSVNFGDKILSPGDCVERDAISLTASERERSCQSSKDVEKNSHFVVGRSTLQDHKAHVITTNTEHSCIYNTLTLLQSQGLQVDFLPSGLWGAVSADQIQKAIRPNTRFIILSAANNETGVKPDLAAIAEVAKQAQIPLYVDGVALLGKEPLHIPSGVSAMGFSAHKCHGPKGTGFLYVREGTQLQPLFTGGGQEFHKRAGTENLAGIAGLAKAIELLHTELPAAMERMAFLRDKLQTDLQHALDPVLVNWIGPRVSNTCNLSFPGIHGEDLLIALDLVGIAVSHGSACTSGALEPSRVLTQMGIPLEIARTAIRFSLDRTTTEEEINDVVAALIQLVSKLRK